MEPTWPTMATRGVFHGRSAPTLWTSVLLRSMPIRMDRRITPFDTGVRLEYLASTASEDPLPFLWSAHPLFSAPPGTRVVLDTALCHEPILVGEYPQRGERRLWPLEIDGLRSQTRSQGLRGRGAPGLPGAQFGDGADAFSWSPDLPRRRVLLRHRGVQRRAGHRHRTHHRRGRPGRRRLGCTTAAVPRCSAFVVGDRRAHPASLQKRAKLLRDAIQTGNSCAAAAPSAGPLPTVWSGPCG